MEITLSTGKRVGVREKKGQHHFIERRLMATSMGEGGQNLGAFMGIVTIAAIVSIESIDGEKVSTPVNESEIYELMDRFTYEEWAEFEMKIRTPEDKTKLEEAAKNLLNSPGSANA
ncbi:hypothetical protein [Paenibacillus rigui]|uniref:Phage tail assembly protein n=1 Tax=Paenibacillus rigui TaxID=554312 RepID=A0A229UMB2_9BACL|nr:hypothetical protein [Paenibacillus rigui]OXM84607.1 hypothetical protein CF651_19060 [Paenibacillus rigui]